MRNNSRDLVEKDSRETGFFFPSIVKKEAPSADAVTRKIGVLRGKSARAGYRLSASAGIVLELPAAMAPISRQNGRGAVMLGVPPRNERPNTGRRLCSCCHAGPERWMKPLRPSCQIGRQENGTEFQIEPEVLSRSA